MKDTKIQEDFVGKWFEAQKKLLEYWQNNFKRYVDSYSSGYDSENDLYKEGNKFFEMFYMPLTSEKAYENLKSFYMNTIKHDYNDSQKDYTKKLSNNFVPYLPKLIQDMFEEAWKIQKIVMKGTEEFCNTFFVNNAEFQSLAYKGMMGDKEAVYKYINRWNENFKNKFKGYGGKSKEDKSDDMYTMQIRSISNYINYYNSLIEFNDKILKTGQKAMEAIMKKYEETVNVGIEPESFEEFYSFWWRENERVYKELFSSREFIDLLDSVADAIEEFKKSYGILLDKQLEMQPFATKKDIENLKKGRW